MMLPSPDTETVEQEELRDFMLVLYRALMMLARYIERRYHIGNGRE